MTESVSLDSVDAAVITPLSTTITSEVMMDRVLVEVFGKTKFNKIKRILDDNEIQDLVELAMYDYSELVELQGSVQNIPSSPGFEAIVLSKTEAKKLSLLKSWYKSQPNASWQKFTKDQLDSFIMGNEPTSYGTPANNSPSKLSYTPYTPLTMSTQESAVADFNKSIKRSTGDYPELKEEDRGQGFCTMG